MAEKKRNDPAPAYRADGKEQHRIRTASVQAKADILLAQARRDARTTRGQGEAAAIATVDQTLDQEPAGAYLKTLASGQPEDQPSRNP